MGIKVRRRLCVSTSTGIDRRNVENLCFATTNWVIYAILCNGTSSSPLVLQTLRALSDGLLTISSLRLRRLCLFLSSAAAAFANERKQPKEILKFYFREPFIKRKSEKSLKIIPDDEERGIKILSQRWAKAIVLRECFPPNVNRNNRKIAARRLMASTFWKFRRGFAFFLLETFISSRL